MLADLQSGLVIAMVALPLSMALAIATGVAPQVPTSPRLKASATWC